MPGRKIPDSDHASHFCGGLRCDDDGRPRGSAFMLRVGEDYLSANWLESTGSSTRTKQLATVRKHLTDKGFKLTATGRLAVLHLETVFKHVKSRSADARSLSAHHEPELPYDPSHSGIYGYNFEDDLIADLIAEAVHEHYPARG